MSNLLLQRNAKITITDTLLNESVELSENRIQFNVQKAISSLPNLAEIKITNPSEDFVNFSKRENLKVDLEVSYFDEELDILFTGDLKRAYFGNSDINNILIIECGDAEKLIFEAFLNKSYTNGVLKKTIVKDCISLLGIDILNTTLNKIIGSYNGGFVSFNKCVDVLDIVINGLTLEWSIQNNQLLITEKGETNNVDFVEVDFDSGLIDTPITLQDSGLLLKSYINTKLIPHNTLSLNNVVGFEGLYQMRKVNFQGDNEKGIWEARVVCL